MSKKRQHHKPRPWQPMRRAIPTPISAEKLAWLEAHGFEHDANPEIWMNDRYVVHVDRRADDSVETLSIRRCDRKAAHDWRHFQMIKNDIAGPEIEAVELYPAMSRLMDTSNQYWLWCAEPGVSLTIGFEHGEVVDVDHEAHVALGSKQRALPEEWR